MKNQMAVAAPSERDITKFMDALRALVRELRLSSRAVERSIGVSGAQLFVLEELADSPARSVNELAGRTATHQSTVSIVTAKLAARGLVMQQPSREDARRTETTITDAGRELLKIAPETAQHRIITALRSTAPKRVKELAGALEALVRTMGIEHERVPMFLEDDD